MSYSINKLYTLLQEWNLVLSGREDKRLVFCYIKWDKYDLMGEKKKKKNILDFQKSCWISGSATTFVIMCPFQIQFPKNEY